METVIKDISLKFNRRVASRRFLQKVGSSSGANTMVFFVSDRESDHIQNHRNLSSINLLEFHHFAASPLKEIIWWGIMKLKKKPEDILVVLLGSKELSEEEINEIMCFQTNSLNKNNIKATAPSMPVNVTDLEKVLANSLCKSAALPTTLKITTDKQVISRDFVSMTLRTSIPNEGKETSLAIPGKSFMACMCQTLRDRMSLELTDFTLFTESQGEWTELAILLTAERKSYFRRPSFCSEQGTRPNSLFPWQSKHVLFAILLVFVFAIYFIF